VKEDALPTTDQAISCTQLIQNLTAMFAPIYLVRLDERTRNLFILAGDSIEIAIQTNGRWEFL
jgi:hypothetical protein